MDGRFWWAYCLIAARLLWLMTSNRANLRLQLCHSPQAPVSTLSSLFVYFLSVSSAAPLLEVRGRGRGQTRTGAHRYLLLLRPYLWRKPPPWLSHEPLYYLLWLLCWDGYCTSKKVSMSTLRNFMAHIKNGFSCQYGPWFLLLHSCTPALHYGPGWYVFRSLLC